MKRLLILFIFLGISGISNAQMGNTYSKFESRKPGKVKETLVLNKDSTYICKLYYPRHGVTESYQGNWDYKNNKLLLYTSKSKPYSVYHVKDTADGYDLNCRKW